MTYDRQIAKTEKAGLRAFRERLLAGASGDVLEIGGGTGANLPWYGPAVTSLTITEPQPPMLRRLEGSVRAERPDAKVLRAPAEDLPFGDGSFDVVVSTLVLCGVDDQPRALRELRRVLRPGGRLLFIEHLRSDDPGTARLQDRLNWLNRLVVCCDCNRPTLDSIRAVGFTVAQAEHTELPKAPPFVRPTVLGSATALPVLRSDMCRPMRTSSAYASCGCRDGIPRRSLVSWGSGPPRQPSWSAPRPPRRRRRRRSLPWSAAGSVQGGAPAWTSAITPAGRCTTTRPGEAEA
jgi:SAM-dependent methyltransferase